MIPRLNCQIVIHGTRVAAWPDVGRGRWLCGSKRLAAGRAHAYMSYYRDLRPLPDFPGVVVSAENLPSWAAAAAPQG